MSLPLSVTIITRNEEKKIRRCLESVSWADEIVVVDGGSTDATLQICRDPKASWASRIKVYENPWQGFRVQRMFSLEKTSHDWVLVLDSDEACSSPLREKISHLLSLPGGPPIQAYKIKRQEYFLRKPIHYGIWNPSYQDRFFHKRGVYYVNDIHEYPIFGVKPGRLEEPIDHDPDFGPDQFLHKLNIYTTIEAKDRVAAGRRTNVFRILSAFPAMFWKNYFYYKSYRDGVHGVVISVLEGISRAVRHVKIWQHSRSLPK
jgi:glycosyltransferase involved in cell wall biosynthesis